MRAAAPLPQGYEKDIKIGRITTLYGLYSCYGMV
jgi:hypothetical protein